jgi:hypothetical protein
VSFDFMSFGATGNGTTDETGAWNTAYAALQPGDTLIVTRGIYKFSTVPGGGAPALVVDKNINLQFEPGALFMPSIGTGNDFLVLNSGAGYSYYNRWQVYIVGGAGSCKNAVVLNRPMISDFEIHVQAGTASNGYGVIVNGGILNRFSITESVNAQYPGWPNAPVGPANNLLVRKHPSGGYPVNACRFYVRIEGGGVGVRQEAHAVEGNNTYSGCVEGTTGQPFYAKDSAPLCVRDMHFEAGGTAPSAPVEIENCNAAMIGPNVHIAGSGNGGKLKITNAPGVVIDCVTLDSLEIDSNCVATQVRRIEWDLTGSGSITDNGTGTLYLGPIRQTGGTPRTGLGLQAYTFAQLGTATNGTICYVTNGTPGSNPLTGTGSGCLAIRQNGVWRGL